MKLGIKTSKFEKVGKIKIPAVYYNRMKCGIKEFDDLFGNGILPGSSMTFTGQAGCGKCHAPDQEIEVFGDKDLINQLKRFIQNS